jgi:predicted Co/Zn/Cd cation transporter (cation efflux family)
MSQSHHHSAEARALRLGTIGNTIGAVSALIFYLRSSSDALLLDGLYTAVMAGASVIAARVSRAALQPRSRAYPFGASGQEPLYVMFRTLVLLGIIVFAMVSAAGKVLQHLQGGTLPPVSLDGLGWYFIAMVLLNLGLWKVFAHAWSSSGRNNEMLRGMVASARFDALISAGTGIALLGAPQLVNTVLAPLVPIADALLVLVLSVVLLPEPLGVLQSAVAEAAGFGEAIPDETRTRCSTAVGPALREQNCHLSSWMVTLGWSRPASAPI